MSTAAQVFVGISVVYVLVVVGGVVAWRWDRAERFAVHVHELSKLKIQLDEERATRQEMEGYYLLDDAANLDRDWRDTMAYAIRELESNDPDRKSQ